MTCCEDFLVITLKIGCSFRRIGAREFIMKKDGIRIVHNSKAAFPEASAIIGFLVISRLEALIETAGLFPDFSRRNEKCARAVIDITAEHVHRRKRIVAPAVTQAGCISPDDAAGFLKGSIEQN